MPHKYKILDSRIVENTKIELRDDGILQFFYADNMEYTMQQTRVLEQAVQEMTKGITHRSLRITAPYTSLSRENLQRRHKMKVLELENA